MRVPVRMCARGHVSADMCETCVTFSVDIFHNHSNLTINLAHIFSTIFHVVTLSVPAPRRQVP